MATVEDTVQALAPFVASPATTAVLLDLDGTLAPIVPRPSDVAIPPNVRTRVAEVVTRYGLTAIVSGRQIDQLTTIVGIEGLVYSGNHGHEIRLADGSDVPAADPSEIERLRRFVATVPRDLLDRADVWLEDKGATVTFHYREAQDPELARRMLETDVAPAAEAAGLDVEPGRMSLEVHPSRATTKGTAVATILERSPQIDRVVSLGDDRTDVEVWKTLHDLRDRGTLRHGAGIAVVSDESPAILLEHADLAVEGIAGTQMVLAALLGGQPA